MAHRTTRPTDRDDDRLTEYTREGEHGLVSTEKLRRESDLFGDERETLTDGGTVVMSDESPAETLADDVSEYDSVSAAMVDDTDDIPAVWIVGHPGDMVRGRVLEQVREHGFTVEWVSTYESAIHDDPSPYFRVTKAD